jgi:hypothetical protein
VSKIKYNFLGSILDEISDLMEDLKQESNTGDILIDYLIYDNGEVGPVLMWNLWEDLVLSNFRGGVSTNGGFLCGIVCD